MSDDDWFDGEWSPGDAAFEVFMATVKVADLSPFEYQLWQWHWLHRA